MPDSPRLRPKDAATLILVRTRAAGAPEILMGRRPQRQAFMPDQYVFPGGRVDASDRWVKPAAELRPAVAARLAKACSPARARSLGAAAIRETFEETGLMLAAPSTPPRGAVRPEWQPFHAAGLAPALDRLDYIYRAVTPPGQPRRFDARFFVADGSGLAGTLGGNGELLDLRWVSLPDATALPIPRITALVLAELARLLPEGLPLSAAAPVPVCKKIGRRYVIASE